MNMNPSLRTHTDTDTEPIPFLEFYRSYTNEGNYSNPISIEIDSIPVLDLLLKPHQLWN